MATDTSEKEQAQADWKAGTEDRECYFQLSWDWLTEYASNHSDPNKRDKYGCTNLHFTVLLSRNPDHFCKLMDEIEFVSNPNPRNQFGQTPLHFAAHNSKCHEALKLLLAQDCIAINAQDQWGLTSLHYATLYNVQPKNAVALLDAGADPSIKDMLGRTPLEIIKKVTGNLSSTEAEWRLKDAKWWQDTDFAACPKCGCRCCGAAATARPDTIIDAAAKDAST